MSPLLLFTLSGLFLISGCSKSPSALRETTQCGPGMETLNGYRDDDNCPDQLARLRVVVMDQHQNPLPEMNVRLPGMNEPSITGADGGVVFFELIPSPKISIEVENPSEGRRTTVELHLKEGPNEIQIRVELSQ